MAADAGLTEFVGEGLRHLTVEVERDNGKGHRFYERAGRGPARGHPRSAGICAPTRRIPSPDSRETVERVDGRGMEQIPEVARAQTGQVLTVKAPAPGVGWP